MNDITSFDLRRLMRNQAQMSGVWLALAALLVFGLLRYENFGSAYNLTSFLNYNSMFVVIALGMSFVIMAGGIDLSVGFVAAFSSIVAAYLSPYGLGVALLGGICAGAVFGLVNAVLIVGLQIPPFIATLAMMLTAKGGALIISGRDTVAVDWGSGFTRLGMETAIGPLPWTILIAFGLAAALWVVLEHTPLGRTILAVGDSPEASLLMGLSLRRAQIFVYVLSGACAGLAGVFLASGFGAGQPLEGVGWELTAIASVVVGGTLLSGGMGSVPATVAGALLLGLVFNLLNFENGRGTISLSAYWQMVIRGGVLLAVVLLQVRMTRKTASR